MKKKAIYNNDWLKVHPYKAEQSSDREYVDLANQLFEAAAIDELPAAYRIKMAVYVAAYVEDVKSNLGLWGGFTSACMHLYGKLLPFYHTEENYDTFSINREDVKFIVWNTWQKAEYRHGYVHPEDERIVRLADIYFEIIVNAYETIAPNEGLYGFFDSFRNDEEAVGKMSWLFAHTYLTEPSLHAYIDNITQKDIFVIPTGPLALFLHEWIEYISFAEEWKNVKGLYTAEPELTADMKKTNAAIYKNFTKWTNGKRIIYLNGYEELRRFLVEGLHWPDDENHTLPQMKKFRNFIMMTEPDKGVLLAKDICECIADPDNTMYDPSKAAEQAFQLLTKETLCPPDLLIYCLENGYLPDAVMPGTTDRLMVAENADFIARHALLYYYRGD